MKHCCLHPSNSASGTAAYNRRMKCRLPSQRQEDIIPVAEKQQEPPKEVTRRKKQNADYGSVFLQRNEIKTRQCVYISREIHNKVSKIVNVIADKEITVGGYIDSVLAQHLEQHKDEINELYRKQREDLI